jgi:hypothetical protein
MLDKGQVTVTNDPGRANWEIGLEVSLAGDVINDTGTTDPTEATSCTPFLVRLTVRKVSLELFQGERTTVWLSGWERQHFICTPAALRESIEWSIDEASGQLAADTSIARRVAARH